MIRSRSPLVLALGVALTLAATVSAASVALTSIPMPTPTPLTTSTQLASMYGFYDDPACQACLACDGYAAQASMSRCELYTYCSNVGVSFFVCLNDLGVMVSTQEAHACHECNLCPFPSEC